MAVMIEHTDIIIEQMFQMLIGNLQAKNRANAHKSRSSRLEKERPIIKSIIALHSKQIKSLPQATTLEHLLILAEVKDGIDHFGVAPHERRNAERSSCFRIELFT